MATFEDRNTGQRVTVEGRVRVRHYRQMRSKWREVTDGHVIEGNTVAVDTPDGTAAEVIAWAGDDPARRQAALDAEHARSRPRKTVIAALGD